MREAGEGFEARRSARSKPPPATAESTVRAGVSARGTGVKVGNLPKDSERRVIKKKTGKLDTASRRILCSSEADISSPTKISVQLVGGSANSCAAMDARDPSTLCVWNRLCG